MQLPPLPLRGRGVAVWVMVHYGQSHATTSTTTIYRWEKKPSQTSKRNGKPLHFHWRCHHRGLAIHTRNHYQNRLHPGQSHCFPLAPKRNKERERQPSLVVGRGRHWGSLRACRMDGTARSLCRWLSLVKTFSGRCLSQPNT